MNFSFTEDQVELRNAAVKFAEQALNEVLTSVDVPVEGNIGVEN